MKKTLQTQEIVIQTFLYAFFLFAFAHLLLFLFLFVPINSVGGTNMLGIALPSTTNTFTPSSFSDLVPLLAALVAPLSFSVLAAVTALKKKGVIGFTFAVAVILLHLVIVILPGLVASVGAYAYVWTLLLSALLLGLFAHHIQSRKHNGHTLILLSTPFLVLFLLYLILLLVG